MAVSVERYVATLVSFRVLNAQHYEAVKLKLMEQGILDINDVQAVMLYHIGDTTPTIGELILLGCYVGTNVSYNVNKLAERGYLKRQRREEDHRVYYVRLTDKGLKIHQLVDRMYRTHVAMVLQQGSITGRKLKTLLRTMEQLGKFLSRAGDFVS